MKTQTKMFQTFSIINLLLSPLAVAQVGDRAGNGGTGPIAQFEFNVGQIQGWLERNNLAKIDLENPSINKEKLSNDMVNVSKKILNHSIQLRFTNEELKVGEEIRTCKNYASEKLIECNTARWNENETPESRYVLTMHELISIAGYENNDGIASEYNISRKILPYVAPAATFILVDQAKKKGCNIRGEFTGNEMHEFYQHGITVNDLSNPEWYFLSVETVRPDRPAYYHEKDVAILMFHKAASGSLPWESSYEHTVNSRSKIRTGIYSRQMQLTDSQIKKLDGSLKKVRAHLIDDFIGYCDWEREQALQDAAK